MVKRVRLICLILFGLGILLTSLPHAAQSFYAALHPGSGSLLTASLTETAQSQVEANPTPTPANTTPATIQYQTYLTSQSFVHVVRVPTEQFLVTPAVTEGLEQLEQFAQTAGAIAGVNGGFFDPVNQQTTSYIVVQGEQVADPTQNDRLMTNPDLTASLDRILNRSEFRQYECGEAIQYSITAHLDPVPSGCQLVSSLGAGPRLLPELALSEEAFAEIVNGEFVRDALGSQQPNARTAIGITDTEEILLVMAAQLQNAPTHSGMSLPELASFMEILGATSAMNLDGGSSSALYYRGQDNQGQDNQGQTYYGRVDAEGNRIERPVKSVLLVHAR
ncbi:hypothetical protein C7B76_25255 [filamentous cyanobacterium CCP2]|nr:hypothetical protein C7B76_25255 [filamentous cyanobacterium CCP2]